MKNKKGAISLIVIILIIVLLVMKNYRKELNKEDKKILIEKSYSNYAGDSQYKGKAIFNDGTIYSWNFSGSMTNFGDYNINSIDGLTNYILEKGRIKIKRVSADDLEKIKSYINDLEDSIEIKHIGADQGTNTVSVWNNANNKEIILSKDGDSIGENKTKNAQELLKIIKKYL